MKPQAKGKISKSVETVALNNLGMCDVNHLNEDFSLQQGSMFHMVSLKITPILWTLTEKGNSWECALIYVGQIKFL